MNENPQPTGTGPSSSSTFDQVNQAASDDGARSAFGQAKEAVKEAADEIGHQASEAAQSARQKAEQLADRGKSMGAGQMEGLARAARGAADELEEQSPEIAGYVRQAADGLQQAAASVRNRSIGEVVDALQDFARRQPAAYFGSTVLAGFALSRFMKSRADRPHAPGGQKESRTASPEMPAEAAPFRTPDNMPTMPSTVGEIAS